MLRDGPGPGNNVQQQQKSKLPDVGRDGESVDIMQQRDILNYTSRPKVHPLEEELANLMAINKLKTL